LPSNLGHLLPDEIEILVVGTLVLMDNMIAVMRWLLERGFHEVPSHVVGHP
jgi:hypothetical protein